MPTLQIPEHLEEELRIAAEFSGRTKEELATDILAAHFEDTSWPLSPLVQEKFAYLNATGQQHNALVSSQLREPRYQPIQLRGEGPSASEILIQGRQRF